MAVYTSTQPLLSNHKLQVNLNRTILVFLANALLTKGICRSLRIQFCFFVFLVSRDSVRVRTTLPRHTHARKTGCSLFVFLVFLFVCKWEACIDTLRLGTCACDWNDVYSSTCHMQFSHWCILHLLVTLSPFPTSEFPWCSVHKISTMFTSCVTPRKLFFPTLKDLFPKLKIIRIAVECDELLPVGLCETTTGRYLVLRWKK